MTDAIAHPEPDVMAQTWCCLTCNATFRFGLIRMANGGLHCPRCDGGELHPAGGEVVEVPGYAGPIGPLN